MIRVTYNVSPLSIVLVSHLYVFNFESDIQVVAEGEEAEHQITLGLAALLGGDFVFPPPEYKLSKLSSALRTILPSLTLYLRFKLYLPSLRGTR